MATATVNERFVVSLQGKDFITYEGLLSMAHENGLKSIEVEIIQLPSSDNGMTAICKATAVSEKGTFIDIGDASPSSVNRNIAPHAIRMASTRAKARALRDLNNVGMTAIEEVTAEESLNATNNKKQNQKKNYNKNSKPKVDNSRITQEQANELKELIRIKNVDMKTILEFNKIPAIEAMTVNQYQGAKRYLAGK